MTSLLSAQESCFSPEHRIFPRAFARAIGTHMPDLIQLAFTVDADTEDLLSAALAVNAPLGWAEEHPKLEELPINGL